VGRTARAGAQGLALTLMSPDEWLLMADIEKLVGQTFPRQTLPGFEPSVAPIPPASRAPAPPTGPSIRSRRGSARRR
jgi:ATP-dependent RNA helicase RhlE